ncbi:MAG: DNA polymerase III subunit delta [Gemmataceae bacterium]
MDALDFLKKFRTARPQPVYVLVGDEDFLKRQARRALESLLLEDADPAFAVTAYPGDQADWSVVRSELATLPFLSPCRVVVVEQADPFVTANRPQLEKYVTQPAKGTLVLDVKTWPSTTKLAKLLPDDATIVCRSLKPQQLPPWCVQRATSEYQKKLPPAAAQLLVDLAGPSLGVLDQELAKLAAFVGQKPDIDIDDVDQLVGRSRQAETFKIFDAVGNARPAEALAILHRLLEQGEDPLGILGAFSWQLRRLAQANRLVGQGLSLSQALAEVGVRDFAMRNWEQQLRHLGRRRLEKLYDWLLEVDLGLKGGNPLPPAVQLERLVLRLAQPRDAK